MVAISMVMDLNISDTFFFPGKPIKLVSHRLCLGDIPHFTER
jgi:hypothetical protein